MKRYVMGICLLLSGQTAIFGCATCVSLAEKSPKMPKSEVYVQLKKKNESSKTRRRKGRKKKTCSKCKAKVATKKAE